MLYINEWLPNPVGTDTLGEFIELFNSGQASINLNGYSISDGAKKRAHLSGIISGDGYTVFKHGQTKLTLKNTSGSLFLYGPNGSLVDEAAFVGVAPEGKSYSRVDYTNADISHFAFMYPTPGAKNNAFDASISRIKYPLNTSLTQQMSGIGFLTLILGTATSLVLFFIYVARANRNISNFFFRRNEGVGLDHRILAFKSNAQKPEVERPDRDRA